MKLKGIYKLGDWIDQWNFWEWLAKHNLGINLLELDGAKIKVSFKHGNRRKLHKKTIRIDEREMCCTCCPPDKIVRII